MVVELAPADPATVGVDLAYQRLGMAPSWTTVADLIGDGGSHSDAPAAVVGQRIEIVVAAEMSLVDLRDDVIELGDGPDVCVVVAASRMGEAHRALRGAPCVVQPWWTEDGATHFGRPEQP